MARRGYRKPQLASSQNTSANVGGANALSGIPPSGANSSGTSNTFGSNLFGNVGQGAQTAGGLFNIAQGLRSGTPTGVAQASIGAAGLANKGGAFGGAGSNVGAGLGAAGGALGIYNGIQQGGVQGYGGAAIGAARVGQGAAALAGNSGLAGSLGAAAGYAAVPLSVYSAIANYQSGDTGGDALRGAEAGAAIGSVVPVIGTAVGAIVGGAVGAISSAFGNGKVDPENKNFESYTQSYNKAAPAQQASIAASLQNPYLPLAGYFDLRSNQMKGSNPIYTTYGRQGEQKFTSDLISKVQGAQSQGITDPSQIYNSVISPWISSMGTWNDSNKNAMTALIQNMTGQVIDGTYKQNFKAVGGQQVW